MAPEPHGKALSAGLNSAATSATMAGPPPSTLAAQLVETISVSETARSTRTDETVELKRLLAIIERVKDEPELLKTAEERVAHNHMLIYVYARVVFEALRWDDPFANQEQLRADALKAIEFLRVTIQETPAVLKFKTDGSFLFRGPEPLWAWLFPRVLKMLGHNLCLALTTAIESFFQYVFTVASQVGLLWEDMRSFIEYFQAISQAILHAVHEKFSTGQKALKKLELPPADRSENTTASDHSYIISDAPHALRHVSSLLSVLYVATIPSTKKPGAATLQEYVPWLLDSCLLLQQAHISAETSAGHPELTTLKQLLELVQYCKRCSGVRSVVLYKAYSVLTRLCSGVIDRTGIIEADPAWRLTLATCLVRLAEACIRYNSISRLVSSQLLRKLSLIMAENESAGVGTDFWRSSQLLEQAVTATSPMTWTVEVNGDKFQDQGLRDLVRSLQTMRETALVSLQPQSKRRKLTPEASTLQILIERLRHLLGATQRDDLHSLEAIVMGDFSRLSETSRCLVIEILAHIPCAADGTLVMRTRTFGKDLVLRCSVCGGHGPKGSSPICTDASATSSAVMTLAELIRLPSFLESRRPRVVAMAALCRLLVHCTDADLLDLEVSKLGQWCLQSLQSSIRELRIAAGRTLAKFLDERTSKASVEEIIKRNRGYALGFLKTLSDKDSPHLNETCIMAWGHMGRTVPDEELNLVLVQLIEYLGNGNTIISATASNEILNLANAKQTSPKKLLEPFWKSLAFSVVKSIVSRPQTTKMIADLLQISVADILLLIQAQALPWLVLTKKRDVIQKIAEARGEEETWQPCMDPSNMSSILALLLSQEVPDVEEFSMSLLRNVSSHFDRFTLVEFLRAEPVLVAFELLKEAGEGDDSRKRRMREALTTVASMLLAGTKEGRQKKSHIIGQFLQHHALGLTTRLTEVINDTAMIHPSIQEQKRCICAMEEMIVLCKSYIRIAQPQISACLLSALSFDELRSLAFSCWTAMLVHLEDEDVEELMETTFFIINNYWSSFDGPSRLKTRELLTFLLENESHLLRGTIDRLPSLGHHPELVDLEKKLNSYRQSLDNRTAFVLFTERIKHENSGVVLQALDELARYLRSAQGYLQASAISEQPDSVVVTLTRALLDCASKYNGMQPDVVRACTEALGLVGCLDSNRIETVRGSRQFVVLHNFTDAAETTDFVLFLLEEVLVKSFLSATDTNFQGFLSFVMQELLDSCGIKTFIADQGRQGEMVYRKWLALPETVREILSPFMTSSYRVGPMNRQEIGYPMFQPNRRYANWMRFFVLDLLRKGQNYFAQLIFEPLCRVIRVKDLSPAEFLLPYLVVHIIVGEDSTPEDRRNVMSEILGILQYQLPEDASYAQREDMKLHCEAVFKILDYIMRWLQTKKAQPRRTARDDAQIAKMQEVLDAVPGDLISQRAVDCKQYARALFHLEPHMIRKSREEVRDHVDGNRLLQTLQHIYTQIDEPDGLEGISASLAVLDIDHQILSHRKAGRWTAAQSWYEIKLAEQPENIDVQLDLLACLKESGQHDVLLNYVEGMKTTSATINKVAPFAVEASWATERWQTMQKYLNLYNGRDINESFNMGIAQGLLELREKQDDKFSSQIQMLRDQIASSMTYSATSSLEASHDAMLKCHVLTDLELIAQRPGPSGDSSQEDTLTMLNRRLEVIGAYVNDKQYVLGVRRAAMELMRPNFADSDISSLWLSSARLARKAGSLHQSFNAVLHASKLGDGSSTIENARLLYKQGHHRQAIQILQNAINDNAFMEKNLGSAAPSASKSLDTQRNLVTARAHLLCAKWLDSTGLAQASTLRLQYQLAARIHPQWEKGHYYLGRHYKKVLESEKALKPDDQSDEYLSGETAKLVIENFLRSLNFGTKYLYQTLPRILTLWLELGTQVKKAPEGKLSLSRELHQLRLTQLHELHKSFYKHLHRIPAYIFYTGLPQMVARIAHPNGEVFKLLEQIIVRVVDAHPRQALWALFAIMTPKQPSERRSRGMHILQSLRGANKKVEGGSYDLKQLLRMGEKLAEQLLLACNNGEFQSNKTTVASITRDLNFNHKCTPCPLVVPIQACLTATLPTLTDNIKKHKAFSRDVITIESFLDEVLVLGSLAKPRRLTARGSDGRNYALLIKPKDDLRTDQRLMEFNGMINRSLKRDAESSRRQLYIRTYAVTPLNEECGIIEWVDGLKTLRDILLGMYKTRGISPNYGQIGQSMKEAFAAEDCARIFTEEILGLFPPVLPEWFMAQFPSPTTWFAARLKYTRSCAVMSMVGTILGLGDRHGENVLLEEGNGGVFHVDFNCLFDKGLTFAQPERVPFRLTHNMVAAMGIYGYEGPFRKCSELTLTILRQQEETLMTILEAFIYDPTLDLQRDNNKKRKTTLDPTSVVESIRRKVKGLLPDESIPLGVEGQVEELIKQAVSPRNLAGMYIGWCPFL